ncbi:MAG: radical SAM protein, partial [Clostridia bacterium]|nr:radical SAM protein [Clostridia bacterium]
INIPVFIPHLGCPNKCVFCDQKVISGTEFFDEENVRKIIEDHISTSCGAELETAFFGGSFTGIDRELMVRLLNTAQKYVDDGAICGIRMSTRPDYIDEDIISILKNYTITQVELGIQSMSDKVLALSRRGHSADDTVRACELLVSNGFQVGGQMMVGLPGSTSADEIETARAICRLGCTSSRIYPTIVFADTELDRMYRKGEYSPLSTDEAARRAADCLEVFGENGVKCLRIGLCDSDNLHSGGKYSAGPNHPSMGEIVVSKLFYKKIKNALEKLGSIETGSTLVIECPKGAVSKVVGNKRENAKKLHDEFGIKRIKTIENDQLLGYNIKVLFS